MSAPATVLITSRSFSSGSRDLTAELRAAGLTVMHGPATHDLSELYEPLSQAVAWIAGTGPITAAHLDAAPHLRIVARYGVGVDAVALQAAAARGIVVTNTPGANSDAVADHAIALLLTLLRGIVVGNASVRAGNWRPYRGRELGALTVGIAGFGHIGQALARRLAGFGTAPRAYDPFVADYTIRQWGAEPVTLPDLAACDAVSLHAPGGRRLVDADWLQEARPGLLLVNTARADLVDEEAVAAALRSGRLAGYAADTLCAENTNERSLLLADDLADRVVVTPHTAAQTVEAIDRMGATAVADVLAVLGGRQPAHVVQPGKGK